MLVDLGMTIANLREALGHRREGEVFGIHVLHLVPRQRRRNPRFRGWADGIGRRYRSILGVLVVIHEDTVAFFLPPLAGGNTRRPPLDFSRECQRGTTYLVEPPALLDPHDHVHSPRPRGLGPPDQPEFLEGGMNHLRDLADLGPLDPRDGSRSTRSSSG